MLRYHSEDEYMRAIKNGNKTTAEIAEYVGVAPQTAYDRLQLLEDRQKVKKSKYGTLILWQLGDE